MAEPNTFKDCTLGETDYGSLTFPIAQKVREAEESGGGTITIPAGEWVNVDGTLVPRRSQAHISAWITKAPGVPRP